MGVEGRALGARVGVTKKGLREEGVVRGGCILSEGD